MCTEAKGSRALGKHGDIWICLIHGTPEPSQKLLIKQITSQNRSSYPRIHPELHWECWQHSGKQRMDFVRGEVLLLAQGSTAEIKGSRFDITHNFYLKKIKYLLAIAEELGVEDRPLPVYDSMASGGSVRVCTGQLSCSRIGTLVVRGSFGA